MKQGWIRIGLTFCMMLVMCMTAGNVACATVATTEVSAVDSRKVSGNVKKKIVKKNVQSAATVIWSRKVFAYVTLTQIGH